MKARFLTKLLNDTNYIVNNNRNYIAVGSPMCHDLIKVDKKTLKVKYALDTWNEGRKCLEGKSNTELLFIWDKLHELIESGKIKDIIEGNDVLENPLPVFTCDNGILIETYTDKYGWPNTDINGNLMHDNTYFKTKQEAIDYGIEDLESWDKMLTERIEELNCEVKSKLDKQAQIKLKLANLKS